MKSFRKSRDAEGKFALSTPQNPLVNASPRELAAIAIKQLQESIAAAERKKTTGFRNRSTAEIATPRTARRRINSNRIDPVPR
jgi:hypothetical protein